MATPLHKKNLKSVTVENIERYLTSNGLKPGDRLPPERTLAEEFGVSRTVIRDAVKTLDGIGILDVRQRVGIFVADVGINNVARELSRHLALNQHTARSLLEVRLVLETATARWAARRCDRSGAQRITKLFQELKACAESENSESCYPILDRRFHVLIAELSGNPVVLDLMRMLLKYLAVFSPITHSIPGRVDQSVREHEAVIRAIRNKSPLLAAAAMEDHLRATFKQIIDSWDIVKKKGDVSG